MLHARMTTVGTQSSSATNGAIREIPVAPGRVLRATPVFDTYWRFAAERQRVFIRRIGGSAPPWTDDPVLVAHRFTNVYRAADRVSQFLIREVLYSAERASDEIFFRALLFKFFNKVETWQELCAKLGVLSWSTFSFDRYARALDEMVAKEQRIYSAAYIMPSPPMGNARKHRNHLRLLEQMMRDRAPLRVMRARSLQGVFEVLKEYPSLGDFLGFQFAIDLNYSEIVDFSEMDFVVAGPGAKDGIRKCFASTAGLDDADVIRAVADMAEDEFRRLGLAFATLWGRPLQLIDCQNLFCEVGKYARSVHPDFPGVSGRTRIKQRFLPRSATLPQWYPPKWGLTVPQGLGAPPSTRPWSQEALTPRAE